MCLFFIDLKQILFLFWIKILEKFIKVSKNYILRYLRNGSDIREQACMKKNLMEKKYWT